MSFSIPNSTNIFYEVAELFDDNLEDLAIAIILINRKINKIKHCKNKNADIGIQNKLFETDVIKIELNENEELKKTSLLNRRPNIIYELVINCRFRFIENECNFILNMKYKNFLELKQEAKLKKDKILEAIFRYKKADDIEEENKKETEENSLTDEQINKLFEAFR